MAIIRVELKYCEYCGGLLLRAAGDAVIHCAACARKLADMPQATQDPPVADGSATTTPASGPPQENLSANDADRQLAVPPPGNSSGTDVEQRGELSQPGIDLNAVAAEPFSPAKRTHANGDSLPSALPPRPVAHVDSAGDLRWPA